MHSKAHIDKRPFTGAHILAIYMPPERWYVKRYSGNAWELVYTTYMVDCDPGWP
jgi:hypothetical protein